LNGRLLPQAPGGMRLDATFDSGQVFHFQQSDGVWWGAMDDTLLTVQQQGDRVRLLEGPRKAASRYLALDHDLEAIYATWPHDPLSQEALEACRGIRILRQPLWECVATFITSAQKQVAHIRAISLALRREYGTPIGAFRGETVWQYPDCERLAAHRESDLRKLGLGYRAPLLLGAARAFAEGRVLPDRILSGDNREALEECLKIPGVGVKVAHCILLFAADRLDAVPVDVWIRRVLEHHDPAGHFAKRGGEAWLRERFGPYAGYVQQYLFHTVRKRFGRRGAWEAWKSHEQSACRPATR